jgi:hypothetical protein
MAPRSRLRDPLICRFINPGSYRQALDVGQASSLSGLWDRTFLRLASRAKETGERVPRGAPAQTSVEMTGESLVLLTRPRVSAKWNALCVAIPCEADDSSRWRI